METLYASPEEKQVTCTGEWGSRSACPKGASDLQYLWPPWHLPRELLRVKSQDWSVATTNPRQWSLRPGYLQDGQICRI
jgi:hypothetical protein